MAMRCRITFVWLRALFVGGSGLGNCGGHTSKPCPLKLGRPADLSKSIHRYGSTVFHCCRLTGCRFNLCPCTASDFARKSAISFQGSPACPLTCCASKQSGGNAACKAWNTLRSASNVGLSSLHPALPIACSAVVTESDLKTVGTVMFLDNRQIAAQKRASLSACSDPT